MKNGKREFKIRDRDGKTIATVEAYTAIDALALYWKKAKQDQPLAPATSPGHNLASK
jgi:hypothetical protein